MAIQLSRFYVFGLFFYIDLRKKHCLHIVQFVILIKGKFHLYIAAIETIDSPHNAVKNLLSQGISCNKRGANIETFTNIFIAVL